MFLVWNSGGKMKQVIPWGKRFFKCCHGSVKNEVVLQNCVTLSHTLDLLILFGEGGDMIMALTVLFYWTRVASTRES